MSYYKIFYWLTVADNARILFYWVAGIFSVIAAIATIVYVFIRLDDDAKDEDLDKRQAISRRWMWWSYPFALFAWAFVIFTPSKKDSLLIIAGGGTMNYLTTDSTARRIPHELTSFVVSELRSMASEAKVEFDLHTQQEKVLETAKSMTTDKLIEKMQTDSIFAKIVLGKK